MRWRTQAQDLLTPFLGWLLFAWDCCRRRRTTWSMEPPLERINPLPRRAATTSAPPPWAHTESRRLRRLLSKATVPWLPPTYGPGPTIGRKPTSHYAVTVRPLWTCSDKTLRIYPPRFHLLFFGRNHDCFLFLFFTSLESLYPRFFEGNCRLEFLLCYLFTLTFFHILAPITKENLDIPYLSCTNTPSKAQISLINVTCLVHTSQDRPVTTLV